MAFRHPSLDSFGKYRYTGLDASKLDDDFLSMATTVVEKGSMVESLDLLRDKITAIQSSQGGNRPDFLDSYERLVEAARDGIYVLDSNGRFQYANQSMADLVGFDKQALVGMHASRVLASGELEKGQGLIQEMISEGETESDVFDMQFQTKSGEQFTAGLHFSIIYNTGSYAGLVGVARDVSERIAREQELERQNERLDEFVGVVSHDLRNPLSIATSRLELIADECESDHIAAVERAHERMETLIDDLLTLAREGGQVSETEAIDLAALIQDCWQIVETGKATLVIEIDRYIQADRCRVQQLLENLIRNAVEHGGEAVTITVGELDDGFYIADDGPGIAENDHADLFNAGYSTSDDGVGFGLSIVEQIVDAHGWNIAVINSEASGARFEITGVKISDK